MHLILTLTVTKPTCIIKMQIHTIHIQIADITAISTPALHNKVNEERQTQPPRAKSSFPDIAQGQWLFPMCPRQKRWVIQEEGGSFRYCRGIVMNRRGKRRNKDQNRLLWKDKYCIYFMGVVTRLCLFESREFNESLVCYVICWYSFHGLWLLQ